MSRTVASMSTTVKQMLVVGFVLVSAIWSGTAQSACAADWYAAVDGKPEGAGTKDSPWDLQSALEGKQKIAPGDTLWLLPGTYKYPDRKQGSSGYVVKLAGQKDKPIHVRALPGQRTIIDGGLSVQAPSTWLWIWDLEIIVSENFTMPRRVEEPGSHPQSYNRPWGGLSVYSGEGCKFIHLLIHDNAQGVSWWKGSTNSELYGAIIYDNGWSAPDRGHGHAIYTQNQDGVKTIAECILTGGFSYTMHAYGSSQAYVDNYLIEGNVAYNGGTFLVGGGRPSRNIRVLRNFLYNINMQIGYTAKENEDCQVRDNVILNGNLSINRYKQVVEQGNIVVGKNQPRPKQPEVIIELRPSRYDPRRANLIVVNFAQRSPVRLDPGKWLNRGDKFRLQNPRDFYGKPVLAARYLGKPIGLPIEGEFGVWVMLKDQGD